MAMIKTGTKMPEFRFDTAYEQDLSFYDQLDRPVFLWFIRYLGCPVCQVDIQELTQAYSRFEAKGVKVIMALQSDPKIIQGSFPKGALPFTLICDPEKKLYEQFEIKPAKNMIKMASLGLIAKGLQAKKMGISHGVSEGDELQLPALFLIRPDGEVAFAKYAKNITDLPSIDEMLQMI